MARTKLKVQGVELGSIPFSGCKYTTSQNVPDIGLVSLDTFVQVFDTDGYKISNQFTAPVDGKYLYIVTCRWASNTTGNRILTLRKNGSSIEAEIRINANATTGEVGLHLAEVFDLTAGDYFNFMVQQTSGGNLALVAPQSSIQVVRLE